jgi:hypothetical protein
MTAPRYQEVKSPDIPLVKDDDGTGVRIVCGTFCGKKRPVDGIAADPIYLDVSLPWGRRKNLPVGTTRHAFVYVCAGSGSSATRPVLSRLRRNQLDSGTKRLSHMRTIDR